MTRMRFGSCTSIEARTRKWPPPETAGTVKNATRSCDAPPASAGTAIVFGSFGFGPLVAPANCGTKPSLPVTTEPLR